MDLGRLTLRELLGQLRWTQLWTLATVAVSLVSGAFFLGAYITGLRSEIELAQKEQEIQYVKTQWAYIEPQISLGRYFDLKKHVISVNSTDIPKRAVLLDQQFLAPTNINGLTYYKTSETEFRKETENTSFGSCGVLVKKLPV